MFKGFFMDNDRFDKFRLPLAIFLSAVVFFLYYQYSLLTTDGQKTTSIPNITNSSFDSNRENKVTLAKTNESTNKKFISLSNEDSLSTKDFSTSKFNAKEEFISLENKNIHIKISTYNAVVVESTLKNQTTISGFYDLEKGALKSAHTGALSFSGFKNKPSIINFTKVGEVSPLSNSLSNKVTFVGETHINGHPLTIYKRYVLEGYKLKLTISLSSISTVEADYYLYNGSSIGRTEKKEKKDSFDITTLSYILDNDNENALKPHWYSSEKDFGQSVNAVEWIAIDNRFYLRSLFPNRKEFSAEFKKITSPTSVNYLSALKVPITLSPGTTAQDTFIYSFLPKDRFLLNQLSDESPNILYYLIFRQFSWMKILSDFLHGVIVKIYEWVGDYGWAIVIMTAILKILTYPLTQKSYQSMQKLQVLNPKIEEIRKKYKKDQQKAQREIMTLYRKEKINPAMGCLPMLIPIPIFFALYVLFQNMTELNNASFLWIENLAYPDNLFTLPFTLPLMGANFHLLPIIMAISQFSQSAITPQTSTSEMAQAQTKMIKYFLPIFFLFICWNLPSALVLFWVVQNIFAIFQTLLTKKKKQFIGELKKS